MKKIFLMLIPILSFNLGYSQSYNYKVDLVNVVDDKIKVELECPEISQNEINFNFPAVVPGAYEIVNYRQFIQEIKAFNENGEELKIRNNGKNSFLIENAKDLTKITYQVDDTRDSKKGKKIAPMEGTSFEKDKVFAINNGAVFGFFDKMEHLPVNVLFEKPEKMYGVTSLQLIENNTSAQNFAAESYHQLVDCPILFAKPDTMSFMIKNAKVMVTAYAESGNSHTKIIYDEIMPSMQAIEEFLDVLPVDNYTFIIYLDDMREIGDKMRDGLSFFEIIGLIMKMGSFSFGALEHGNSSYFALPELGDSTYLSLISDVAIHEFLHIITPLSLHSNFIGDFQYINPKMSKHLWLYEGITEYFAGLTQLQAGTFPVRKYLDDQIRSKIIRSLKYPEDMSFTEMSENILGKKYQKQFYQVYQKGAVMAMLLDFEIIRLTDGKKTLKDVVLTFEKKYGKNQSFDEEGFIAEFVNEVHPDLQKFFDNYIIGIEPLDIAGGFEIVGIEYSKTKTGYFNCDPIRNNDIKRSKGIINGYIKIKKVGKDDFVGFQKDDRVKREDIKNAIRNMDGTVKPEGSVVSIPVMRDKKEINLTFKLQYKELEKKHHFELFENMTPEQQKMFEKWTNSKLENIASN
ncbi:hypothetical protein ACFLS4_05100 [Bacteroidota bacterium]